MKKPLLILMVFLFVPAPMVLAHWSPEDGHKMHEPQLPDPNGWAVSAYNDQTLTYPVVLADDWTCTSSGYVEDIHFWGAWKQDVDDYVESFWIAIHEDVPVGPDGFSVPGEMLWFWEIPNWEIEISGPISGDEGWYDPASGEYQPNDHQWFYQYNIFLENWIPRDELFYQQAGHVYWLAITAILDVPENHGWGWKSSLIHYRDNAVWSNDWLEWSELYDPMPEDPLLNNFIAEFDADGNLIFGEGDGQFPDWYWYELSNWWNVWFYDHPFVSGKKLVHMEFTVDTPGPPESWELAVNWSTDQWEPGYPTPPIPGEFPPEMEDEFIGRESFPLVQGPNMIDFEIPFYNPEWVSVDIRQIEPGFPLSIEGQIWHQCIPSLDLAFVINGHGEDIPTLNEWGMIILGLILVLIGTAAVVRRRKTAPKMTI